MFAPKLYKLKQNKVQLKEIKQKKFEKTKLSFDTKLLNVGEFTNYPTIPIENDYKTLNQHQFMSVIEPKFSSNSSLKGKLVR